MIVFKIGNYNCKSIDIVKDEIDCIKMVFYVREINEVEFTY